MNEHTKIPKKPIKACTEIILTCKEVGLEKKIEFAHKAYDDPTTIPPEGFSFILKDSEQPEFNGTYEVKKVHGKMEIGWGTGRLRYILDLKKISP